MPWLQIRTQERATHRAGARRRNRLRRGRGPGDRARRRRRPHPRHHRGTGAGTGLAAGTTEGTGLYTPPATNTATKFALTPRETPQTVIVVTDQVIEDFHLTSVRDVLNTAPFLNVQSERNNGVFYPQTRGGEQLNLQFDGIPGPGNLGYQDALPLDTAIFDRVEVLYGAQGLLAGFGNAGGVINMVRKMPTPRLPGLGRGHRRHATAASGWSATSPGR